MKRFIRTASVALAMLAALPGYAQSTSDLISGLAGRLAGAGGAGYVSYAYPATGALTRTLSAKAQDRLNTADFAGCDTTGATDSTACLNNAIAAASAAKKPLDIAPGTYKVTTLTIANPVTIRGAGALLTTIKTSSATGDVFDVTAQDVTLEKIGFDSSVTRTAGSFVYFEATTSQVTLRDFYMTNYFVGVKMAAAYAGRVQYGRMVGGNNAAGTAGILIAGGNDQYLNQVTMDAPSGTQPQAGIYVVQTGALNITDCDIIHHTNDLLVAPGTGQSVASLWVENTYFDTAVRGILIQPSGTGIVQRLRFVSSWSSSHSTQGVYITTSGASAIVDGVEFIGHHVLFNTGAGLEVNPGSGTVRNVRVLAGDYSHNGAQGILFDAGQSEFSVIGARVGSGFDNSNGGNGSGGIVIAAGASNNFSLVANDVRGNTGSAISDSSTGTSKIISANLGYNPPAETTATPGASPWTYTNTTGSAQTVYINGGTVSLVAVGGANVFQQTNCTVRLPPGVSMTITYSAAPGIGITGD